MAAPSGIVWGSIVGSYGRIGIYKKVTSYDTRVDVAVEIWFWSKYSVSDNSNTLYYDNLSASGSATTSVRTGGVYTTVSSGAGWDDTNQVRMGSYSYTYNRGTAAATRYLYAKLAEVDRVGGTMYASTTFSIPALASFTIKYNANGGSGAPASQTKYYGKSLTLTGAKPTRTGYTFKGWARSASGAVEFAAGASYAYNADATLYAVWEANKYTVSYNANGGTGAPASQTKTYGTALTLSSTKPTRTNYNFIGWGTSAAATTATYAAGAKYTANAAVTLYAVWEFAYVKPIIYNLSASRCDSTGAEKDDGKAALVKFNWECTYANPTIRLLCESNSGGAQKYIDATGTSGSISEIVGEIITYKVEYNEGIYTPTTSWITVSNGSLVSGAKTDSGEQVYQGTLTDGTTAYYIESGGLSAEITYTVTVRVEDEGGLTDATTTLSGYVFPLDVLAGGKGISFGKPAELGAPESLGGNGVADFAFDAKFNEPVYGKALGMDRLPAIPANSDLNSYMEPGCYAVYSNANSETIANIPVARAGRLEVWSSTGEGVRLEQWSYLRQRYIPYNSGNAVWEREITRSSDNVWRYYDWWRSSLTPTAAEKVYSRAAITVALNANVTLGALNTYTKIPFDKLVISTSDRLTMTDGSIKIGKGIEYVKVCGQVLVKCGTVTGIRHARIQKVSGTTTTSIAWCVCNADASSNTVYSLAPIIVSVKEGDLLKIVYYTSDTADSNVSGSTANGWQTYMTAEEL